MSRWILLLVLGVVAWRVLRTLLQSPRHRPIRPHVEQAKPDPHAVLGVGRDASGEEITRAYRERLKEYHPDRVATLGPELRELAHRKTIEIQRAWQALRPKP